MASDVAASSLGYLLSNTAIVTYIISAVFVATLTRLASGYSKSKTTSGAPTPPAVPYWLPGIGNALDVVVRPNKFIASARARTSGSGAVSLNVMGRKHTLLFNRSYAQAENTRREAMPRAEFESVLLSRICGLDTPSLMAVEGHFSSGDDLAFATPFASELASEVVDGLQDKLPNFVSRNRSSVDQMSWEREADATITASTNSTEDAAATECNLFALVSGFTANVLLESLMPASPPTVTDALGTALNAMNINILPLFWGLPRWLAFILPLPSVHTAKRTMQQVVSILENYHRALDDHEAGKQLSVDWVDLGSYNIDQSAFGIRRTLMKSKNISANIRAKLDAVCLWHSVKDAAPLVFWILLNVQTFPTGSSLRIKQEVQDAVTIDELPELIQGSGIKEPPKVKVRANVLSDPSKSPSLHQLLVQTIQTHFKGMAFRQLTEDETLEASDRRNLSLSKGSYIAIAHELLPPPVPTHGAATTAPGNFSGVDHEQQDSQKDPPSSFMVSDPAFASIEALKPFVLTAVAGILSLWDIDPAPAAESWDGRRSANTTWNYVKTPATIRTASVDVPKSDIRVRITRRPTS